MNDTARRIISDRMRRGDRDSDDYRMNDRRMRDYRYRDYESDYRGRDRGGDDYRGNEHDGRRGVYGTGRYGVGGRDYGEDYGEKLKLKKEDMKRWKKMLKNADGSTGEHFTAEQLHEASRQIGANFEEYDETDLCMTANMLYSDLSEALRNMIPKEREPMVYAKLAKAWLEDEDGPEGSEKLALYYHCIVADDEE
jgi:hypothetical protein